MNAKVVTDGSENLNMCSSGGMGVIFCCGGGGGGVQLQCRRSLWGAFCCALPCWSTSRPLLAAALSPLTTPSIIPINVTSMQYCNVRLYRQSKAD
jgi:hypothetical protein